MRLRVLGLRARLWDGRMTPEPAEESTHRRPHMQEALQLLIVAGWLAFTMFGRVHAWEGCRDGNPIAVCTPNCMP